MKLPLAALRFKPEDAKRDGGKAAEGRRGDAAQPPTKTIYKLLGGAPVPAPVQTGISDGKSVEISGEGWKEGDPVIVEENTPRKGDKAAPAGNFRLRAF